MYIKLLAVLKQVSCGMLCSFHYNYNTFFFLFLWRSNLLRVGWRAALRGSYSALKEFARRVNLMRVAARRRRPEDCHKARPRRGGLSALHREQHVSRLNAPLFKGVLLNAEVTWSRKSGLRLERTGNIPAFWLEGLMKTKKNRNYVGQYSAQFETEVFWMPSVGFLPSQLQWLCSIKWQ
jgi:hypothetical protein